LDDTHDEFPLKISMLLIMLRLFLTDSV